MSGYTIGELEHIAARSLQISRYTAVSVYALQVYEWLLTLEEEHTLIHRAPWSSAKVNYFICRYYPLVFYPVYIWSWVVDHNRDYCARIIHPLYAFIVPFQLSAQAVMLIRAYAFTGRKKHIAIGLWSCFTLLFGAQMWLFGTQFILVDVLYLIMGNSGCYANERQVEKHLLGQATSSQTGLVMLATFLFDFLMMAMVVLHCIRIRSTQGPLGRLFLAQAISVFVVMSCLNLLIAVIYLIPDRQYDGLGFPFMMILPDIFACRLILILRDSASHQIDMPDTREQSRIVREALEALDKQPQNEWCLGRTCRSVDLLQEA